MKDGKVETGNQSGKYYNASNMEESYQDDIAEVILNYKQPEPINPEVKDYELLPEKEKRALENLEDEIKRWARTIKGAKIYV